MNEEPGPRTAPMTSTDPNLTMGAASGTAPGRRMRLAYLTTQYPAVSHTFIRRELLEIERRGHEVHRFAIRPAAAAPVDPLDKEELTKTMHVLKQSEFQLLGRPLLEALRHPGAILSAVRKATQLAHRSERGLLKHLAYVDEATILLHEFRRRRIEHVHVHFGTNAAAVAMLVRLLGGPPFSMTVHGPAEFDAPIGLSLGDKIRASSFVCAISDYCSAQLRRWVGIEHWDKIKVIRCTVGEQFFKAARPLDPSSKTLVCIGRLAPQKGHLMLLDAFSRVIREGMDARLVLCGDGELRAAIERMIAEQGLKDRVTITGWIGEEEVRRHLLESRCMVLPSFAEGLPMVIMEALALGRPVISTSIAGIPELVVPGESGWLVTPGRADQISNAIRQVLNASTDQLETMAAAGRRAVLERHNTVIEGERLERLFLELGGAANGTRGGG